MNLPDQQIQHYESNNLDIQNQNEIPTSYSQNKDLILQAHNNIEIQVEQPDQIEPFLCPQKYQLQYKTLKLISIEILSMILGCLLSLNKDFSYLFIDDKYTLSISFQVIITIQYFFICLLPFFRTHSVIIQYQKELYIFQLVIQVPIFIGIARLLTLMDLEAGIYIILIISLCTVTYQQLSIIFRKSQLSLIHLNYTTYFVFSLNFIFALLFALDMKSIIIIEFVGIYVMYYLIQLTESFTFDNNFKNTYVTIMRYLSIKFRGQQMQLNRLKHVMCFGFVLGILLIIQMSVFLIWYDMFTPGVYILWAITANTQIINQSTKLSDNHPYLAAILIFSDMVNFIPNVVRSLNING